MKKNNNFLKPIFKIILLLLSIIVFFLTIYTLAVFHQNNRYIKTSLDTLTQEMVRNSQNDKDSLGVYVDLYIEKIAHFSDNGVNSNLLTLIVFFLSYILITIGIAIVNSFSKKASEIQQSFVTLNSNFSTFKDEILKRIDDKNSMFLVFHYIQTLYHKFLQLRLFYKMDIEEINFLSTQIRENLTETKIFLLSEYIQKYEFSSFEHSFLLNKTKACRNFLDTYMKLVGYQSESKEEFRKQLDELLEIIMALKKKQ